MNGCGAAAPEGTIMLTCSAMLFDLDGVLVHSSASVRRSWTAWAALHGIDQAGVLAASTGTRTVDTIRQVAPALDAVAEAARLESEQALDVGDVTAGRGARALVDALADHEWAIVTSGTESLARARLEAAGLRIPKVFVTGEAVTKGKPDPAGYLLAARLIGQAPEDCLAIEDAAAGVEAARRGGMRVLGLTNGDGAAHLAGADLIAESCAGIRITRHAPGTGLLVDTR
jgi:sugar-phosphatase